MATPTTPARGVIVGTPNYNSFSYRRKNRRQVDALTAASFLLIGNGVNYGMVLFTLPVPLLQTYVTIFFVGALLGALVTSFLLHQLRKTIHYYLASAITLLSGILYVVFKTGPYITKIPDGLVAANFFSGLAFGIVFLTAIVHGAGVAVKYLRGYLTYQHQISIDCGIFILFVILRIVTVTPTALPLFESIGVTLIVASILSFITTFLFCIESPEFLYETNNDAEALVTIKRLRKQNIDTVEIVNDLEEIQNSVRMANNISKENLILFIKILLIRLPYILGTSIPINMRFMTILLIYYGIKTVFVNGYVIILLRLCSAIIGSFVVGKFGHKKPLLISLFLSGLLLIIFNSIYIGAYDAKKGFSDSTINALSILICIYECAIGFGSGGLSLLAMSEAFSFNTKSYKNAIIIVIECIIQIIIINTVTQIDSDINIYIFITGFVQLIVCGLAMKIIPETHQKSLKESNELYLK